MAHHGAELSPVRRMGRAIAFLVVAVAAPALPATAAAAAPPAPKANIPCTPGTAHPYPVVLVHGTSEIRQAAAVNRAEFGVVRAEPEQLRTHGRMRWLSPNSCQR